MKQTAKVINFPKPKNNQKNTTKRIRNIDGVKYFNIKQIQLLRRTVREQAQLALAKNTTTAVREWMAVDLLTSSGIRVSEASNLRCGDINCSYGECSIFVREGKNLKSRTVEIPQSLKKHLKSFISWKKSRGEDISHDAHIFIGQRGPWSAQAIQCLVKKYLRQLGLYTKGKSVHSLRHSYATELYRKHKDIRAIQKLLGHSTIYTTQIYADVSRADMQSQVEGLWAGTGD